jgi:hypothetical protein
MEVHAHFWGVGCVLMNAEEVKLESVESHMSEYLEKIEQREGEEWYLCGISTDLLLGT